MPASNSKVDFGHGKSALNLHYSLSHLAVSVERRRVLLCAGFDIIELRFV
jgi:hypothetical protein